ncbi:MAG: response regulator transcription factor [Pseudobdellovibrionaceae bacterium]
MKPAPTVFVIDDDPGMRKSLTFLFKSEGFLVETFKDGPSFLRTYNPERPGCLILDIRMPGMSGLEVQEHLFSIADPIPIIIISAHADVSSAVRALKGGSFDFLEKPYSPTLLLERVKMALEKDQALRAEKVWRVSYLHRVQELTAREKQILALVVAGKPSKMVADRLGLSVSTVDNHRARIMKKLKAETTADLTRIALLADPNLGRVEDLSQTESRQPQ